MHDDASQADTTGLQAAVPERPVRIEPMTAEHASQILAIYQTGIDEGNATFETQAPDWAEFSLARL
ncbi:MAG TPA: hypothetical protein VF834_22050, partial [Streptosporangiaceae bacterium]